MINAYSKIRISPEKKMRVVNPLSKRIFLALLMLSSSMAIAFFAMLTSPAADDNNNQAYAHHVLDEIDVTSRPMRMSLAGDLLYVSNLGEPEVSIINTTSGQQVGNVTTNGGVMAVEAVPEKNRLYVATFESGGIDIYELDSKRFLKTAPLPDFQITYWYFPKDNFPEEVTFLTGGWSMDYNPANGMLYVANFNANSIAIIDTNVDAAVDAVNVPAHPFIARADPASNILLVASEATRDVTLISMETNEIIDTVTTGCAPWGIDVDSQRNLAYITHRACFHIAVLDIATHEVIGKIPVGSAVQAISIDPSEHMIYLSYMDRNTILKIDGQTNEIISTIEVDNTLFDIVADPVTHTLYASTKFADKVLVIGPESMASTLEVITIDTPMAVLGNIRVHGQDTAASNAILEIVNKRLKIDVDTRDGGDISIQIPRIMLDAKSGDGIVDSQFQVFIDGRQVEYDETLSSEDLREITVFVPQGSQKLEVIGTIVVPEFRPAAS
jgi:YVTN family beta-propeller protein